MAGDTIRIAAPQVIHESIDGETIIINLDTGTYYSAKGSAGLVWALIDQNPGISEAELVETVAASYSTTVDAVAAAVGGFLAELRSDKLAVEVDDGRSSGAPEPLPAGEAWAPPALAAYTDMQDLVLLDPVHQVNETGWPAARSDVGSAA